MLRDASDISDNKVALTAEYQVLVRVEPADERLPIRRLKSVSFSIDGREYMAIEQNSEKPSGWGRSPRAAVHKFIAVAVYGQVKEYGAMAKHEHSAPRVVRRLNVCPCVVQPMDSRLARDG